MFKLITYENTNPPPRVYKKDKENRSVTIRITKTTTNSNIFDKVNKNTHAVWCFERTTSSKKNYKNLLGIINRQIVNSIMPG